MTLTDELKSVPAGEWIAFGAGLTVSAAVIASLAINQYVFNDDGPSKVSVIRLDPARSSEALNPSAHFVPKSGPWADTLTGDLVTMSGGGLKVAVSSSNNAALPAANAVFKVEARQGNRWVSVPLDTRDTSESALRGAADNSGAIAGASDVTFSCTSVLAALEQPSPQTLHRVALRAAAMPSSVTIRVTAVLRNGAGEAVAAVGLPDLNIPVGIEHQLPQCGLPNQELPAPEPDTVTQAPQPLLTV